jgi:hypothetical protein
MTTIVGTLSPPKCEAHSSGWVELSFGRVRAICQARRGLRSFPDAQGVTRFYCPALGHRYDVERRFGVAGPEDGLDAYKEQRDLAVERVR